MINTITFTIADKTVYQTEYMPSFMHIPIKAIIKIKLNNMIFPLLN